MDKFVILGGKPLQGEVVVSGAKNAAVAMIAAALIVEGECAIENIPAIRDVEILAGILKQLGAEVVFTDGGHTMKINAAGVRTYRAPYEMVQKIRASSYLMGALLARFRRAEVGMPGGCNFGVRPIDQHIKGFEALGATVTMDKGVLEIEADALTASTIYLDVVSVGATINIMLAATRASGTTIIENAAKEPHVVDIANFLNTMGAKIRGAGTDVIRVTGVERLCGGTYSIIPDQIEAGTFMLAAAASGGDVLVKNIIPKHMESISAKLIEMGAEVTEYDESIRVRSTKRLQKANVKTLPYPGFPTDMQPQMVTLLSVAEGTSILTEGVWENRFQYVDELQRLGAKIKVDGRAAIIEGVEKLAGGHVNATDLRAGAAMVMAGLIAEGVTEVHNLVYIDRGYENLEGKLRALGAQIVRKPEEEEEPTVKAL